MNGNSRQLRGSFVDESVHYPRLASVLQPATKTIPKPSNDGKPAGHVLEADGPGQISKQAGSGY